MVPGLVVGRAVRPGEDKGDGVLGRCPRVMNALYLHNSSRIGGGNKVLLSLFKGLDRSRFRPISIIPEPGPIEAELLRVDVPYQILDLRPGRSRPSMAMAATRLSLFCLRNGIRLVHAND